MGLRLFVLHSAITPNAVADALRSSIDEERCTLISRSRYRGKRPLRARLASIHSDCRSANITAMTSPGNSMLDLCLSRGGLESRATSMFSVGPNTSCVFGLPSLCWWGPPIFTNHYVWGDLQANPNKLTGDVLRYGGCDHCPQMSIPLVLLTPVMAPSIRQASSIR
jgi:hypothetical protein